MQISSLRICPSPILLCRTPSANFLLNSCRSPAKRSSQRFNHHVNGGHFSLETSVKIPVIDSGPPCETAREDGYIYLHHDSDDADSAAGKFVPQLLDSYVRRSVAKFKGLALDEPTCLHRHPHTNRSRGSVPKTLRRRRNESGVNLLRTSTRVSRLFLGRRKARQDRSPAVPSGPRHPRRFADVI